MSTTPMMETVCVISSLGATCNPHGGRGRMYEREIQRKKMRTTLTLSKDEVGVM